MSDVALAMAVAQRPGVGGHTWVALQYLLGFRRLGLDVTLVDRLEPEFCHDPGGSPCEPAESVNAEYLRAVMESFGLEDSWTLLLPDGETLGLPRPEVERRLDSSSILLNVMGYLEDEDLLARPAQRVFLDIDPGFPQMWRSSGSTTRSRDTTGSSRSGCGWASRIAWCPTAASTGSRRCRRSCSMSGRSRRAGAPSRRVASWRGAFGPIDYAGPDLRPPRPRVPEVLRAPRSHRRRLRAGARDRPCRLRGHRGAEPERLGPARSGGRRRRPARLPRLRRRLPRRADGGEEHVRGHEGRLVQRSQRLLPGERQAGARPGDRVLAGAADGRGPARRSPPSRRRSLASRRSAPIRARHAAAAREIAEQHLDAGRVLGRLLGKLGVG